MKQHHGVDAMMIRPMCWVVCRIDKEGREIMLTIAQDYKTADEWVREEYPDLRRVRSYPCSTGWTADRSWQAVARSWVVEHDNGVTFVLHGLQGFVPHFD